MRFISSIAAAFLAALASTTALSASVLTFGTDTVGWIDTNGTSWLRLDDPVLAGKTYADYAAGIDAYGYRWSLASRADVGALWGTFDPGADDGSLSTYASTVPTAQALIEAFGYTYHSVTGGVRTIARAFTVDQHRDVLGNLLWVYSPQVTLDYEGLGYWDAFWTDGKVAGPTETGVLTAWMIGTALPGGGVPSVPLPAGLPLMLIGLGALRLAGRRPARHV